MASGCLVTAGLLTVAMGVYWATTPARALFVHMGLPNLSNAEIDRSIRALAFAISMVPLGALIYGLLSARRCFVAFAAGQIFAGAPIGGLKAFSIAVAASALLKPLTGAALSVLLSAAGSTGTRTLMLDIGSDTLIALLFSGTVAIIAWVMTEAIDIAAENDQFV